VVPEPFAVSQLALDTALQLHPVPVDTLIVPVDAFALTDLLVGDSVKVQFCVVAAG
jgi:hypothetical protein